MTLFWYRTLALSTGVFIAAILSLPAQIFSGMDVTESQLGQFVKSIKQLQPSQHTGDDVLRLVGAPHTKSSDGTCEEWYYGFLVTSDEEAARSNTLAAEISNLQEEKRILSAQLSKLRIRGNRLDEQRMTLAKTGRFMDAQDLELKRQSKSVFAEADQVSAAIDQVEAKLEPLQKSELEMSFEHKTLQVNCNVALDVGGRVAGVEVSKFSSEGRKLIYSRGSVARTEKPSSKDTGSVYPLQSGQQAMNVPPESPALGQIYFNTQEKAFFGWNGNSWEKLSGGN
jgi:hypothetical protein